LKSICALRKLHINKVINNKIVFFIVVIVRFIRGSFFLA